MIATLDGVRAPHVTVPVPGGHASAAARLAFDTGLGRVVLRSARECLNGLLEARFTEVQPVVWAADAQVHVEYPLGARLSRRPGTGEVILNARFPWSIDVHGGAERLDADLTDLDLRSLAFHAGLAHARIGLPRPIGRRIIRLGSVDHLRLERPEDVPVRIEAARGLTGLTLDDRTYGAVGGGLTDQTPGYACAEDRYLVLISGGAADVSIGPI